MAPKRIRPIRVEGNIAYVPLSRGHEAIIDADDVPLVSWRNWHAVCKGQRVYAQTNTRKDGLAQKTVMMHQVIAGYKLTDHRNGNGLDNRRVNLREATITQNNRNSRKPTNNTSGVKGVTWDKQRCKWRAIISVDNRLLHLGYFGSLDDAASAYAGASSNYHGEFGRTT